MTTRAQQRALLAAVDAEASVQDRIVKALVSTLGRLWRSLVPDPFDQRQVEAWADAAGKATGQARSQASGAADAYLRRALQLQGVSTSGRPQPPAREPRGIDPQVEWSRPPAEFRRARISGLDELVAEERALTRAAVMAGDDVAMARRDAYRDRLVSADRVTGWRRIIHPELSVGGTCGLCVAAADRVYGKAELLPLHARCACTVLAVTDASDPGSPINAESLADLYKRAGGTDRQKLAELRFAVHLHSELGPQLRVQGDAFRGPEDVAAAEDRPAA